MPTQQFPHKKRKLTAPILTALFIFLAVLNVAHSQFFVKTRESELKVEIMRAPFISSLHERLGQYYLGSFNKEAKREYLLAQEFYPNVLGASASPEDTWKSLENKIQNLESERKFWERVKTLYPSYLYSYLKLAILDLQKNDRKNAYKNITTVLKLDPGNIEAANLLKTMGD